MAFFFFFLVILVSQLISFFQIEMLSGSWCLGIGLGNLDGWDGDYTIHVLPAGFLLCLLSCDAYVFWVVLCHSISSFEFIVAV